MGVSQLQMTSAWLATDDAHQTALLTALTQLGVEYRSATSEPGVGFDCSGSDALRLERGRVRN